MGELVGPSATEVSETLRQLRRTPQHLKGITNGRTDAQLRKQAERGSWSVHEVLAHLRGCADVRGAWIARMLADDGPTIRYASPRTGMKKTGYEEQDPQPFLRSFARQRADLVKTLAALELADWTRSATFTGTSPGWTQTVFDVARGLVTHEEAHFEQIEAAAGPRPVSS